jgi:hypothetical protein
VSGRRRPDPAREFCLPEEHHVRTIERSMRRAVAIFLPAGRHICRALPLVLLCACSPSGRGAEKAAIAPTYDAATGKLTELAYDSDHDGTVDTWTDMDGARAVRTRIDRNEDGKLDRWEYYDESSRLVKVGYSRTDNGKVDAWAFAGADGSVERIEISSLADEKRIDRREQYRAGAIVSAEEDTNHDGVADRWETYDGGVVRTVVFDENNDGRADRRLTYARGVLTTIERDPDADGRFRTQLDVGGSPPHPGRVPQ